MEKTGKISESTLVPISLILALLGGAGWLTMVYARGESNAVAIEAVKASQEKFNDRVSYKLDEVLERLTRMEERKVK